MELEFEFEINANEGPEAVVKIGLAQLESGMFPMTEKLASDISAYKWILKNNLSKEYLEWKDRMQPRYFRESKSQ